MKENKIVSRETTYNHIIASIKKDIDNKKFCHAYLFEGGSSDQRFDLALRVCKLVLCEDNMCFGGENVSEFENISQQCSCCDKILNGKHPDVYVYGDELTDSGHISVEKAREIKKLAGMLPAEAEKKIFIIKNADNLNVSAQNALLKIFEEPPEYVVFILLCSNRGVFLPTTLSRMVVYRLRDVAQVQLADEISKRFNISNQDHSVVVSGYIRLMPWVKADDITIRHIINGYNVSVDFFGLTGNCRLLSRLPKDREELIITLNVLSLISRDLLCLKYASGADVETVAIKSDNELAKCVGKWSIVKLSKLYDVFSECSYKLEKYANVNAVLSRLAFINS